MPGFDIVIPAGAKDAAGTFKLTPTADDIDGSDETVTVSGVAGNSATVTGTSLTITDDDAAGVTVVESDGGTATTEAGGKDSFTVVLTSAPTANVTIAVSSSDITEATVSPAALTFTPTNWKVPQTVTVTGVDDTINDGDQDYTVLLAPAVSTDTNYNGRDPEDVSATNVDNEGTPVVTLVLDPASITEGGSARFTLSANPAPAAAMTVSVTVTETGRFAARGETGARSVTLGTGGTASFTVATEDDGTDEADGAIIATVDTGSGYAPHKTNASASVAVNDNDDPPLVLARAQAAFLSRFGRTVGLQAMDAITDRLEAERRPGFTGALAGQALPGLVCDDDPAARAIAQDARLDASDRQPRSCGEAGAARAEVENESDPLVPDPLVSGSGTFRLGAWRTGEGEESDEAARTVTGSDLIGGTSFSLTTAHDSGASVAFWGGGAYAGFSGQDGDLSVSGDVTSFTLGADWARERHLLGVMLSRSRGEGEYSFALGSAGEIESDLTAVIPYGAYELNDRFRVWGAVGLGRGSMTLRPGGGGPVTTGIDWRMVALGVRGALTAPASGPGISLDMTADALWTRTTADAVAGRLVAVSGETTRLRFGLEGRKSWTLASGATLTPDFSLGLRHDGGDAETGFGLEIGGGLGWSDPARGLEIGLAGRRLVLHEADGFKDWGLGFTLSYDPTPETKRGFSARLAHDLGGASSGGVAALLGSGTFPEASQTGGSSWSAEMAYGVSRGRGRVDSPYSRLGGRAGPDTLRLGYRIEPDAVHATDIRLDLWLQPKVTDHNSPGDSAGAGLQWNW